MIPRVIAAAGREQFLTHRFPVTRTITGKSAFHPWNISPSCVVFIRLSETITDEKRKSHLCRAVLIFSSDTTDRGRDTSIDRSVRRVSSLQTFRIKYLRQLGARFRETNATSYFPGGVFSSGKRENCYSPIDARVTVCRVFHFLAISSYRPLI